jgi:hypothetical protein
MGREVGPWLIGVGVVLLALGALASSGALTPFGRLPGDVRISTANARIYLPFTSMVLFALILNIVVWLVRR